MNEGIFNNGILVGRFQHLHIGHEKIINIGLRLCNKLLVFIGSANQDVSQRNPLTYEERKAIIEKVYKNEIDSGKLVIAPLNDLEDSTSLTPEWGEYVIGNATEKLGNKPDLIIYGKDKDIFKCFSKETVQNISEVFVDRNSLGICATKMREYLVEDNKEEWMKFVNPVLIEDYEMLRQKINESCCKKN